MPRADGGGGDDVSDADGGDDVDGDMLNELESERGKRGGRMWDKREAGAGVWCE